jgi:fermentation-respiration switch protein FrsA (DUF1100 family)
MDSALFRLNLAGGPGMNTITIMAQAKRVNRWKNIIGALIAPVLAFGLLRWFEQRTVYQPTAGLDATGDEIGFAREDIWLTTSDGIKLHAWYFPENAGTTNLVFLVCHGNGGNVSHRMVLYDALLREGLAVLAFDYRGYGRSDGSPDEQGTYLDAESAYDWLIEKGYHGDQIIAFGESLGGGVASELASRKPVAGLVLQSTYTSAEDLGAELFPWLPVRTVGRIKYNTRERLPKINVPVLILHSPEDTVIPVRHARENFGAANEPKLLYELHGDHNDTFHTDREAFVTGIRKFKLMLKTRGKDIARENGTPPNPANADQENQP